MKGLKIFHPNGDLLSKPEAYEFYNVRYKSPESEAGIGKEKKNVEPLWLITSAVDAFGNGTHGCLDLTTGRWQYFREGEFSEIQEISEGMVL